MSDITKHAINYKAMPYNIQPPTVIESDLEELGIQISYLIQDLDTDQLLNAETKLRLKSSLVFFIHAAIAKYIKGQKEHGGDLVTRDLIADIKEEHIDMFHYLSALSEKINLAATKKD